MSGCPVWISSCGVFLIPYACISNEWVLLTHCFWRIVPYVMVLVLAFQMSGCSLWITFWRSAAYAMFLMLVFEMSGCFVRTCLCGVFDRW